MIKPWQIEKDFCEKIPVEFKKFNTYIRYKFLIFFWTLYVDLKFLLGMPPLNGSVEKKIAINLWFRTLEDDQKMICQKFFLQAGRKDVIRSWWYPGE